jgi:hypothetical protein
MSLSRRNLVAAALAGGTASGILPAETIAQQATSSTGGTAPSAGAGSSPARGFAQITQPANGVDMPAGYARTMAQFAYAWAWPLVNTANRRKLFNQAPEPGLLGGVVPVAPNGRIAMLVDYISPQEHFVTCPNQDVVYGFGYFSLDDQPVVVQVPDFGDRFWVYALYDARTDQFGHVGKPYNTKPGHYLLAGPRWHGTVPAGLTDVVRSPTELGAIGARVFLNDTASDRTAIRPLVNQVVVYPLTEFDGKMKTVDYARLPHFPAPTSTDGGETKWVVPERFFDELPGVLDDVPPLPGEEAIYANLRQLVNVSKADPAIARVLHDTAIASERELVLPFFEWRHNGVPAGHNWNRSKNNAQYGVDYFDRLGTAKSNMYDNRPNETQYYYTDRDASGAQLNGARSYSITFPVGETPQVRGFWSLTLYNDKHLFHPNSLNRFSLGTKNTTLVKSSDGSLTLYAGAKSPGPAREANWLPAPEGMFSLYIRAYWGEQPILDGSWQPPKIEKHD